MSQHFQFVERHLLVQNLLSSSLVLFLNEASKLQQLWLFFFDLYLEIISPGWIELSVFDLCLQILQHIDLVILEILTVKHHSFSHLGNLTFLWFGGFAVRLSGGY